MVTCPTLDVQPPCELIINEDPFPDFSGDRNLSKAELKLTNRNGQLVGFKVKTNAPKEYCVRPNNGFIHPNDTVFIQVLHDKTQRPPGRKGFQHKFLIVAAFVPNKDVSLDATLNTTTGEDRLFQKKLSVTFRSDSFRSSLNASSYATDVNKNEKDDDCLKDDEMLKVLALFENVTKENEQLKERMARKTCAQKWSADKAKLWQLLLVGMVAVTLGLVLGNMLKF